MESSRQPFVVTSFFSFVAGAILATFSSRVCLCLITGGEKKRLSWIDLYYKESSAWMVLFFFFQKGALCSFFKSNQQRQTSTDIHQIAGMKQPHCWLANWHHHTVHGGGGGGKKKTGHTPPAFGFRDRVQEKKRIKNTHNQNKKEKKTNPRRGGGGRGKKGGGGGGGGGWYRKTGHSTPALALLDWVHNEMRIKNLGNKPRNHSNRGQPAFLLSHTRWPRGNDWVTTLIS